MSASGPSGPLVSFLPIISVAVLWLNARVLGLRSRGIWFEFYWRHCITGRDKHIFERKIVNFFLPISFNICFGCSKEQSH